MYKVINIEERFMDRDIMSENIVTEKLEECFDNSIGYSDENNFGFMKLNEVYDCKILLVGDQVSTKNDTTQIFILTGNYLKIGEYKFLKVFNTKNEYFISCGDIEIEKGEKHILFDFFRKDLLEVNGKVTPCFLT